MITAIRAAGGPAYNYRDISPVDDADGGEPGGNIRVGFPFRTDIELQLVPKGGDNPLFGPFQPPQQTSPQRTQQAAVVADFVRQILAIDR